MEIRASLLAVVAVAPILGLSADPSHAQGAQELRQQAPAAAPAAMPSVGGPSGGAGGAPQSSGVETQSSGVGGVARDAAVGTGSDRSAADQSGARSKTGGETSKPETGAERQPSIKQVPGDGTKDSMWNSPIDASIAVHQGRRPSNKAPRSPGLPGRALLGQILNKSKLAPVPGLAHHHDAQKFQPTLSGDGHGAPARNAIGARIEHRVMARRNAASPAGNAAAQSVAPQGTSAASGAQGAAAASTPGAAAASISGVAAVLAPGAAAAATPGTAAATTQNRVTPPAGRMDPPVRGALVVVSSGGAAINGTAMVRRGSGTGAIGGSVKPAVGVISGSNVHLRHP
jgi:hypothetical protein